jgi:hypothetical protein
MLGCGIFGISVCQFNFLFVISGFHRDVSDICVLLKSDAALNITDVSGQSIAPESPV